MINRSDALRVRGGDVIQLEKTREGLQRLGASVDVRLADDLAGAWDYDLVHIFNIQSPLESWRACQVAKNKGVPVVLSTIYWDPSPTWYWTARDVKMIWRIVRALLGRRGYKLYAAWQYLRYPASEVWNVQRQLLAAANMLLPNSRLEAAQIYRDFRFKDVRPPCIVVPNAVDRELFDPLRRPSRQVQDSLGMENFVLQVGRISPEKNPLGLIEAIWDLGVPAVLVGSPSPHHPEYAQVCHERGLRRGNVHFIEWLPHKELPSVYALAAVHALPSWRETPGLVSLEAGAMGCRIVSTSIGSAYEYLGNEAWYCHPADKASIRQAVMSALKAPRSENLRKRVLENYTWDKAAEATLAAYRTVLRDGRDEQR